MNKGTKRAIAALAMCLAADLAQAQALPLVDDFTTGPVLMNLNGEKQTKDIIVTKTQTGSDILGGTRTVVDYFYLAADPFRQNITLQIAPATQSAPAALVYSEGFMDDSNPQLFYGVADGVGRKSLHADLTPYVSLRITFLGIQSGVQFDWESWSGSNSTLYGCGLTESFEPITVDFPFTIGQVNTGTGANLAAVDGLFFESENYGVVGGGWAISQIAFVTADAPPANVVCTAPQMARHAGKRR